MREFVYGTDEQYTALKDNLIANDGYCVVYNNCVFPPSFNRENGRIGFEKEGDVYAVFIDKGLTCSRTDMPVLFNQWLTSGTLRFLEFTDLKVFLRSLKALY